MEKETQASFGALILRERKARGLSLQKIADLTISEDGRDTESTITASYINRLEKNEKFNPSISVVCKLSEILELNFVEVLRSFGYGHLLPDQEAGKYDTVEELLRLNDIRRPTNTDKESEVDYLTQEEKEWLININRLICDFARGEEEAGLAQIVDRIEAFRAFYEEHNLDLYRINLYGQVYTVSFDEKAEKSMKSINVERAEVLSALENMDSRIMNIVTGFLEVKSQKGYILFCQKETDQITIVGVSQECHVFKMNNGGQGN